MPHADADIRKAYLEKYVADNREKLLAYKRAYYRKNRERLLFSQKGRARDPEYHKQWYSENKDKVKAYAQSRKDVRNERQKQRRKQDPVFALSCAVTRRIANAIARSGFGKTTRTAEMLGCDWQFFKEHIERQFLPGMTWENRNLWHIDHIVPLASAKDENDVIALNHYTNLRPLWAKQNMSKRCKQETLL